MPQGDWLILIIMGGAFILIGMGALYWGSREVKGYSDSIAARTDDMREFMERWPQRPQVGAPKIGGLIAIIIGGAVLTAGVLLWLVAPQV